MEAKHLIGMIKDRLVYLGILAMVSLMSRLYGPSIWSNLTSKYSDFTLVFGGNMLCGLMAYILFGGGTALLDLKVSSSFMDKYRIQVGKLPTIEQYKYALPLASFNLGIVSLVSYPVFYFLHPTSPKFQNPESQTIYPELPSFLVLISSVAFCKLVEEIMFYYLHRLFHHKMLYNHFHKKHHEFTAPMGISAFYMDPHDYVLTNLFPALTGPFILNTHPLCMWCYIFLTTISTILTHGGYEISYFPWARRHDFHHETFNSTFGLIGLMDHIHGTDTQFQNRLKKIKHPRAYD